MTAILPGPIDVDVAIVGAGPVGMTLAILLGQAGRSVRLFERFPDPYPLPRAVHYDSEVGRVFQACGIADAIRAISEPADVYEWRNGSGTTLLRFGDRGVGISGWPASSMFTQPAAEQRLADRCHELATVELHRGAEVTAVTELGDRVDVRTSMGNVAASYVVGCDGANSSIRTQLGITTTDLDFLHRWLVVDLIPDEPRVWDPINLQICDPRRPTTAVSGGPGRRRFEFMELPDDPCDLDNEDTVWDLLEPWAVSRANTTIERRAMYEFRARWADEWRVGRIFLAGDAAHQMPPFAGQGMCSGLRDAANLAWKLDLVLSGMSSDSLLDSYQSEREPHVRSIIDFSIELGKVICVSDPTEAALRDEALAAGVHPDRLESVPPLPPAGDGIFTDRHVSARQPFVQGRVELPDVGGGLLDDLVGAGWRLISICPLSTSSLRADVAHRFAALDGCLVDLSEGDDIDGTYRGWFDAHDVEVALQRPDGYLFGATTVDQADDLISELFDHLETKHD